MRARARELDALLVAGGSMRLLCACTTRWWTDSTLCCCSVADVAAARGRFESCLGNRILCSCEADELRRAACVAHLIGCRHDSVLSESAFVVCMLRTARKV